MTDSKAELLPCRYCGKTDFYDAGMDGLIREGCKTPNCPGTRDYLPPRSKAEKLYTPDEARALMLRAAKAAYDDACKYRDCYETNAHLEEATAIVAKVLGEKP